MDEALRIDISYSEKERRLNRFASMDLVRLVCLLSHAALIAENLALRQQLAVFKRRQPRPRIKLRDRLFWIILTRL